MTCLAERRALETAVKLDSALGAHSRVMSLSSPLTADSVLFFDEQVAAVKIIYE